MGRHLPYSKETVARARAINLVEYLQSRGVELVKKGQSRYCLKEHDSLVIHCVTSEWYWNSQSKHGYNAVDFLMMYYHCTFLEAVAELIGEQPQHARCMAATVEHKPKTPFALPPASEHMHRIYAYLTKTRGIDADIVTVFVKAKLLYEDANHNAVFVGYDPAGKPAYGFTRGTLTYKSFKQDLPSSDKRYAFRYEGKSDTLYVFEAAIDMLSFITLHKDGWQQHSYVSLGGVSPLALITLLQRSVHIQNIVLCLDNDVPGMWSAFDIRQKLQKRYTITIYRSSQKDWNNELIYQKQLKQFPREASYHAGTNPILRVYEDPDAVYRYLHEHFGGRDSLLLCGCKDKVADVATFCADFQCKHGYTIQKILYDWR